MITDALLTFSLAQALTSTGTVNSTNVLDMGAARELSIGNMPLQLTVSVGATFTSGGAGTLAIEFQGSVDNSTFTTYLTSPTYALADLTAGKQLFSIYWPAPPSSAATGRYFRLRYIVGGAAMTAGTVNAMFVLERGSLPLQYPAGINPAV